MNAWQLKNNSINIETNITTKQFFIESHWTSLIIYFFSNICLNADMHVYTCHRGRREWLLFQPGERLVLAGGWEGMWVGDGPSRSVWQGGVMVATQAGNYCGIPCERVGMDRPGLGVLRVGIGGATAVLWVPYIFCASIFFWYTFDLMSNNGVDEFGSSLRPWANLGDWGTRTRTGLKRVRPDPVCWIVSGRRGNAVGCPSWLVLAPADLSLYHWTDVSSSCP